MNILALRSFGDYVILLNSISKSKSTEPISIIASIHLKELHDSLSIKVPSNFIFSFEDFKIANGILNLFTNKHFITLHTIIEISAIKKYLQQDSLGNLFVEHAFKSKLLSILTGFNIHSIYKQGPVYESFDLFFQSSITEYQQKENSYKTILIFPDSRKKEKEINCCTLSNIESILNNKKMSFKIAKFSTFNIDSDSKKIVSYSNFYELDQLIKNADFIISSDSLPVHIAELYDIPHWILYNKKINTNWLTRSASKSNYYSTFDQVNLLNDILN